MNPAHRNRAGATPMRLWEVFRFEVAYQLRRASTRLYLGVYLALAYFVTTGLLVGQAQQAGDLYVTAPLSVAMAAVVAGWLGMLATAALAGDAATRDVETRMSPLFFTAPLGRASYLGGRFLGAVAVNALLLAAVPLGLMLVAREPFVEARFLGPVDPASYLRAYAFILLPNLFVSAAILFALSALSRRALAGYGGLLVLFLVSMVVEEVVADRMGRGALGALLDPFGFTLMSELAAFMTSAEQNARPIRLEGLLLGNRVLWLALALVVLALTAVRFRFAHPAASRPWRRARPGVDGAAPERSAPVAGPPAPRDFGPGALVRQTLAVTRRSLGELVGSRAFLAVAAGAVLLVLVVGSAALADDFGTPFFPATQLVTRFLGGFLFGVSVALLTAFYAGELVWGERDAGLSEIADALPVPDGVQLLGRFLALGAVLVLLQAVLVAAGLLLQVGQGYTAFEPGLYLKVSFGLQLADYLLFGALALLVHELVDHKYLGHLVVALCYAFTVFAGRLGVEHNLLVYGSDPGWVYSDVSGFGPFVGPWAWFKLHWAAWALLFAVVAGLFRVRGRARGAGARVRLARLRFTRGPALATAVGGALALATGGFVFYNTNVLNDYRTAAEEEARRAEYERRYGRYEGSAQPEVTGTTLHVEIYPERREVEVRGTYRLANRTAAAIDTVHLSVHPDVETGGVRFDRAARVVVADDALGHRTYALGRPLRPGDALQLRFEVRFRPRGFPNRDVNTSVVGNGTYFDHTGGRSPNHRRWLPVVGYQPSRELAEAAERRAHGLDPQPADHALGDAEGRWDPAGREWIDFEAVIGTAEGQIAVAPGTLRRTWTENGRRYVRYRTDGPVKNAYAIFSAAYAVRNARWGDVRIEIFHHPAHTENLDRMVRSVRASLAYHTRHFGPYPHRQIRIVEVPRYANLAWAYPGTIAYAEGFGFLTRAGEAGHLDTPFMVVAHEVAHQWWGYQVVPAAAPGAPLLTEVLAQYGAMMVLEETYGPEMVRTFLRQMRIEYLNRRRATDVPLLRVGAEPNLVYRKGALAMYTLRAYIGEERVNGALRRVLERHRSGEPPNPTARDLYRELQAATPDSLHSLLADLFEENTLWSLRTTEARAEPTGGGAWRVTLRVEARKLRADGAGGEGDVPMDDRVEIGVFARAEGEGPGEPLYLRTHRIRSGAQTITVGVPRQPAWAGIDPNHRLIDRQIHDNVGAVVTRDQEDGARGADSGSGRHR
jgi:ABC-2 type transport system permease protein